MATGDDIVLVDKETYSEDLLTKRTLDLLCSMVELEDMRRLLISINA